MMAINSEQLAMDLKGLLPMPPPNSTMTTANQSEAELKKKTNNDSNRGIQFNLVSSAFLDSITTSHEIPLKKELFDNNENNESKTASGRSEEHEFDAISNVSKSIKSNQELVIPPVLKIESIQDNTNNNNNNNNNNRFSLFSLPRYSFDSNAFSARASDVNTFRPSSLFLPMSNTHNNENNQNNNNNIDNSQNIIALAPPPTTVAIAAPISAPAATNRIFVTSKQGSQIQKFENDDSLQSNNNNNNNNNGILPHANTTTNVTTGLGYFFVDPNTPAAPSAYGSFDTTAALFYPNQYIDYSNINMIPSLTSNVPGTTNMQLATAQAVEQFSQSQQQYNNQFMQFGAFQTNNNNQVRSRRSRKRVNDPNRIQAPACEGCFKQKKKCIRPATRPHVCNRCFKKNLTCVGRIDKRLLPRNKRIGKKNANNRNETPTLAMQTMSLNDSNININNDEKDIENNNAINDNEIDEIPPAVFDQELTQQEPAKKKRRKN